MAAAVVVWWLAAVATAAVHGEVTTTGRGGRCFVWYDTLICPGCMQRAGLVCPDYHIPRRPCLGVLDPDLPDSGNDIAGKTGGIVPSINLTDSEEEDGWGEDPPSTVLSTHPTRTVPGVKPIWQDVKPTVHDVKPTVHDVKPTVHDVKPTIHDVKPTVHDVKPTVHDVKPTAQDVKPAVLDSNTPSYGVKPTPHDVKPTIHDDKPGVNPQVHDLKPSPPSVKPPSQGLKPTVPAVKPPNHEVKPTESDHEWETTDEYLTTTTLGPSECDNNGDCPCPMICCRAGPGCPGYCRWGLRLPPPF